MTQSKYVFADNPEGRERERLRQFEGWGDRYTTRRLESIGIPRGGGALTSAPAVDQSPHCWPTVSGRPERSSLPTSTSVSSQTCPRTWKSAVTTSRLRIWSRKLRLRPLSCPANASTRSPGGVRIMAALKPGGWLLAEEADWGFCTVGGHPDAAWATDYLHDLFARHERAGIRHPYLGRTLPALVAEFDLESLEGDVAAPIVGEGGSGLDIIRLTVRALRSPSTTLGASEEDLDRLIQSWQVRESWLWVWPRSPLEDASPHDGAASWRVELTSGGLLGRGQTTG